ncbi:hypothetical protein ACTJJ7_01125 [Phyllobacterium sp. 22229]|jgi:hypothetical protein|uniref:Uncharacterized protein n=1 Tax=Phyllobacterium myrsinacearum TaxID=28101 RepID=A0A2S9JYY4_9HYPH|nr:hypothetical protein [Phyllobacterium myrsinacearum]PRD58550.1 hypothetical protein C5750_05475 [Phyllobacterium myrsinacearum]
MKVSATDEASPGQELAFGKFRGLPDGRGPPDSSTKMIGNLKLHTAFQALTGNGAEQHVQPLR